VEFTAAKDRASGRPASAIFPNALLEYMMMFSLSDRE